jgi:hypothetical protein
MRPLRYIAFSVLGLASIAGVGVVFGVFPKQQFEALPGWLRMTLYVCVMISVIVGVWGFIHDYCRIPRIRGAAER